MQHLLIIEGARNRQLGTGSFHMRETSHTHDVFPFNSYVFYKPPDGSRTKMQMHRAGPYIVVSAVVGKYSIQDLLTHKVTGTYASSLIAISFDSSEGINPLEVVARNAGEFFVEMMSNNDKGLTSRNKKGVSGVLKRLLFESLTVGNPMCPPGSNYR